MLWGTFGWTSVVPNRVQMPLVVPLSKYELQRSLYVHSLPVLWGREEYNVKAGEGMLRVGQCDNPPTGISSV